MADSAGPAAVTPERYQLFEAGWKRAGCPLSQVWVQYLGLGGNVDLFDLDAFMHGLMPLPPAQQDILANAINEELEDLFQAAKIPYLLTVHACTPGDPLAVLDELFRRLPLDEDRA